MTVSYTHLVELRPAKPRRTDEEVRALCDSWATLGKPASREGNIVTSLALDAEIMERFNIHLQNKYATIEANEARYETYKTEDAEYLIVAFGCMSRICENVVELAREDGIKLGVLRPITLYPYPCLLYTSRCV